MVLVMTVEPGFGGQAFMESQLDTIREVRSIIEKYNPACELEVDGGISPKTAPLVVEAGANVLVAGSAVYGKEDVPGAIAALRAARNAGAHLLLFGHTHRPCCFQEPDGLWVLNPGSARSTFGLVLPEGEALSCSLLDMP